MLIVKNIASGRISAFDFDTRFNYEYAFKDSQIIDNVAYITTHANLELTKQSGRYSRKLGPNEAIQFIAPRCNTFVTYPYGCTYYLELNNSNKYIKSGAEYWLQKDERLIIAYANSNKEWVADVYEGSDDAKNRMPPSDCDKKYVKSATAKKEGDLYIVTIVMNDQVNPSYADTDGLVKMSKEFLDINDVKKTVTEDPTVSKVVSKLDGTINYKAYTITATMNSKGQFVDITHYGVGDIKADLTAMGTDLSASGALSFNAKYYNFQY